MLAVLVIGKLVATCLTIGTGASGGMFTPLLFCGAMLGGAVAMTATDLGLAAPTAPFVLAGMAGVAGAATRAPVTAGVLVLETTRIVSGAAPIVIVVVVAALAVAVLDTHGSYDVD